VTLLQAAISVGVGIISAPVMAHHLGRGVYGLWMLLAQFVVYLSLVDFGNASIVQMQLAAAQHVDGDGEKKRLLWAVRQGILLSTAPLVLLGVALACWAATTYADADSSAVAIAATTLLLLLGFLINRVSALPNYALFGANLTYRSAMVRTAIMGMAAIADIVVVVLGYGLIGLGVNRVAAQTLIGLNLWRTAKRDVPWFGFTRVDLGEVKRLLRGNVACVVGQWGHMMADGVDVAVIGCAIGPAMIPIYTVTTALPRLVFTLFSQAMQGASAGLAGLYGAGERERFCFVRVQQELMAWGSLVVVLAATLPVNRRFVELWVGPDYYGGIVLSCLGVAWQFSLVLSRQYNIALSAALEFNRMARVQAIAGIAGVVAAVLGARWAGLNGLLAGLVVVRLTAVAANAAHLNGLLDVGFWDQCGRLLKPMLVCVVIAVAACAASARFEAASWLTIAAGGAAGACGAAVIVWWLVFPPQNRRDIGQRILQLGRAISRRRNAV
jgi:O-antigen/teichoic acid export membrane protein